MSTLQKLVIVSALCVLASTAVLMADAEVQVILAGDSIVADYTEKDRPLAGWGELLPFCFTDQVKVINHATGGASTKCFRDWHRWDRVIRDAKKGDYVFIQFAHNDEMAYQTAKYTDPDTTYQENLTRYIKEAKAAGTIPILITPPVRLLYDKETNTLKESHVQSLWHAPEGTRKTSTTYHDAMRKVAKKTGTPLLDLNKKSREAILALPDYEEMKTYYRFVEPGHKNYPDGKKDTTHFSVKGAALMAKILADEIRRIDIPLAKYLKDDSDITVAKLVENFNHN